MAHGRTTWDGEGGKVELRLPDNGEQQRFTLNLAAIGEKLPDITFDRVPAEE